MIVPVVLTSLMLVMWFAAVHHHRPTSHPDCPKEVSDE